MDFTTTLQVSQMIVNELSGSSLVHKMQGLLFKNQGFEKLGQKYLDHHAEEMEWVAKYAARMMDLGCVPQLKVSQEATLVEDPKAYIEADLQLQRKGVSMLYELMPKLACDPTTYDLTKAYLADEEEDQYWSEEQLDMIAKIGIQNWLTKMM